MNVKISGINCAFSPRKQRFLGHFNDVQQITRLAALTHRVLAQVRKISEADKLIVGRRGSKSCGFATRAMITGHQIFPDFKVANAKNVYFCEGKLEDKAAVRVRWNDKTHGVLVFDLGQTMVLADPTIAQFAQSAHELGQRLRLGKLPDNADELAYSSRYLKTDLYLAFLKPSQVDLEHELNSLFGASTWSELKPFDPDARYVNRRFWPPHYFTQRTYTELMRLYYKECSRGIPN